MGLHEGEWLKERIAETGLSQSEFARKAEMPLRTITGWLLSEKLKLRADRLYRLVSALGIDKTAFWAALDRARVASHLRENPGLEAKWNRDIAAAKTLSGRKSIVDMLSAGLPVGESGEDRNIDPYSEEAVPEIPLFDVPVAAGHWTEVTEKYEVFKAEQIDDGRFRLWVRGDSMIPKYKDGEIVEFRCLRPERDAIELGKDYYIQRNDGYATFKRVEKVGEDELILRPLNKKKYPEAMPVAKQEVVRMARAVGKFEIID